MDRVFFYCQHVLGIGHLVRSAEIVRELSRDCRVLFVSGGEKPDGFRFPENKNIEVLQLPPLKTDPISQICRCAIPREAWTKPRHFAGDCCCKPLPSSSRMFW